MANLDPWSYAAKTRKEHAEQVALFMWANMARLFGPIVANSPLAYNLKGWARQQHENWPEAPDNRPMPELKWLHAVHNQGHGDVIRGANAKAEGVKAGVGDVFLPHPVKLEAGEVNGIRGRTGEWYVCGLYIELKRKDAGAPSPIQLEFQTDMRASGYKAEIIHGWELARDEILAYCGRTY